MRIGFFADMYVPHISGVTNHIALYKAHFEHLGHEVFVLTFGDADYADAEPNVVRSSGLPWGSTGWRVSAGYSRDARDVIATLDVAHVHHPFQSGRLAAPLARKANIPLVFTNHARYDLYSDAYAAFVPRAARYAYVRRALLTLAHQCDLVVAPSTSIATWLVEFTGFGEACVIPNGIDVWAFAHPSDPIPRAELGFAEDDFVFCHAGRLSAEKRFEQLAEEFTAAARQSPTARLLVIGDGPDRTAAKRMLDAAGVADRVRCVGMVPYAQVPCYETAADAFVTASVSEVHPLVVMEAMSAGLPVVAISSPGIVDTVEDDVSGLLAADASPGGLATLMARLGGDAALRARLSAGARTAAQAYTLERTADVLLGAYEELVASRR